MSNFLGWKPVAGVVLVLLVSGCVSMDSAEQKSAVVTDVTDGDTVEVRFSDGSTDTVRLLGVDTPEKFGEVNPGEFEMADTGSTRSCLADWAYNATEFVERKIEGRNVTLVFDSLEPRRGDYGRLLAYIELNRSESVNFRLLQQGFARMYDSDFRRRQKFSGAEREARKVSRGLWGCS